MYACILPETNIAPLKKKNGWPPTLPFLAEKNGFIVT